MRMRPSPAPIHQGPIQTLSSLAAARVNRDRARHAARGENPRARSIPVGHSRSQRRVWAREGGVMGAGGEQKPRAIRRWRWRRPCQAKASRSVLLETDRQADGATREQPATYQGRGGLEKDRLHQKYADQTMVRRPARTVRSVNRRVSIGKSTVTPVGSHPPGSPAPALPVSPSAGAPAHARLAPRSHRVRLTALITRTHTLSPGPVTWPAVSPS